MEIVGDPSRIRTCNPRSRNPLLYPVELWDRNFRKLGLHSIANMKNPLSGQAPSEPFLAIRRQSLSGGPFPSARPSQCCAAVGCRRSKLFGQVLWQCRMQLFRYSVSVPTPRVRHLFAHFCLRRGRLSAGSSIMIGLVRAATLCATLALGLVTAQAADKAFKRDDLADSAIKLEAQIKSEAGAVAKSGASLRTDADAAFKRSDFRNGLQVLGQIAATAPDDSANWLRLARTIFQIRPSNSSEQTFLLERASTAAYIAYQRAGNAGEEADALAVLGRAMSERKLWRPALDSLRLSLDLREVADVRGSYERMPDEHGVRLLDYTVDSDSASPRACFQFAEGLAKRVNFAPV